MRNVVLGLLGTLVACGGQISPEASDRSSAPQETRDAPSSATARTPEAEHVRNADVSQTSGGVPTKTFPAECWDYGAPAAGECTVGQRILCVNGGDLGMSTSSGGSGGYGSCEQLCVNENGVARWKISTEACAFYDSPWHVDAPGCACEEKEQGANDLPSNGQGGSGQSSSTPLVLAFDDAPVTFGSNAGGAFDLVADGQCHGSDWPSARTPWLALDRDGNGSIDDGRELFGSAVRLANGTRARNGFEALRELDSNHDGVFDSNDDAFAKVVVWTDRDGDRRSTPGELMSLADAGVRAIGLSDRVERRCDVRGNCEGERSAFTTSAGGRGAVIDVYLKTR